MEVGSQAYDYGYPLLESVRVRKEMTSVPCPDHKGNAPVNSFSNAKIFADARARTVVAPNTDTLYSIAHLDLGKGPITLSHPRMGKRYYSFEMLDPYTNVIDIPGTREDGGAGGSYVIRWSGKPRQGEQEAGRRPGDQVEVPAGLGDRPDAGDRQGGPAQGLQADEAVRADAAERQAAELPEGLQAGRARRPSRRRPRAPRSSRP